MTVIIQINDTPIKRCGVYRLIDLQNELVKTVEEIKALNFNMTMNTCVEYKTTQRR